MSNGNEMVIPVYPNALFPTEVRSCAVGMRASFSHIGAALLGAASLKR